MKLSSVFRQKNILLNPPVSTKEEIVNLLTQKLIEAGKFKSTQKGNVVKAILERERLGSTGIGEGVAIPHAKLKFINEFHGVFAVVPEGIDWRANDGNLVSLVFLFSSPENRPEDHQGLIRNIIMFTRLPHFNKFLKEASSPKEIFELIKEGEANI